MNETTTGIVVLVTLVIVCSITSHAFQKRFWLAVTIATLASVVIFQAIIFFRQGFLDPFVLIAVFTTTIASAVGAILIGLVFKLIRGMQIDPR